MSKLGIGRRHYFTRAEVETVRKIADGNRVPIYNFMTFDILQAQYHRPIYHKLGVGWFYYPDSPAIPQADAIPERLRLYYSGEKSCSTNHRSKAPARPATRNAVVNTSASCGH